MRRAIVSLLCCLLVFCVLLELVTAVGIRRVSRIQRRIWQDYTGALALKPEAGGEQKSILVAGNSLLLLGVDFPTLQAGLAPRYKSARFAVEQTQYLDWQFGLRRLFREGSRPDVVVLCLPVNHLIASGTRGEYFAHYMMDGRDILDVAKEAKLDNTTASNYFFANRSAWLGSRMEVRKWLLGTMMPSVQALTYMFQRPAPPPPPGDEVRRQMVVRLGELKRICESNGARLIIVIPPTLDKSDRSSAVRQAGVETGVPVLLPYQPGELQASFFDHDLFHLNPEGAKVFAARLAADLLTTLSPASTPPA